MYGSKPKAMSRAKDAVKARFGKKRDRDRIIYSVASLAGEVSTRRTFSAP